MPADFLAQVAAMATVTYLVRAVPLALCRGKLKSRWLRDFLFYVPYAVLGAMTFPAVFSSTGSPWSALAGVAVGAVLAWKEKGLLTVAMAACITVFLVERLL
jgi:branched-subunit amino acid transport protein